MARKYSRRTSSSTSSTKSRQGGPRSSVNAFYGDVLGIAGSLFRNRQQAGAEKIGSLASAARNFAADLTDIPNMQSYAHAAADQMESLGDYVSDNSMEQIAEDAMDIAKRHPVATVVFAVAVGFGFTRLMTHGSGVQPAEKPQTNSRKARSPTAKRTTPKKRVSVKAKANGQYKSQERTNAA
jgi:hypothetical protein